MEKKEFITIASDKVSDFDFSLLKSFYREISGNEIKSLLPGENIVGIIDGSSTKNILALAENLRAHNPVLPLLIMRPFGTKDSLEILNNLKGIGQIRFLYWQNKDQQQLLEYTQSLLHPEYPTGRTDIAIILPVYNEESRFGYVRNFTAKLKDLIESAFINVSIYFVNDGSKDRTEEMVKMLSLESEESLPYIERTDFFNYSSLIKNTRKAGTYIEGIRSIQADVLIFADADDSFSIDDIARFINIIRDGYYDMVVGTKDTTAENRSSIRRLMSFCKRLLTKSLLPSGVHDSQTGLKALNSIAARHIIQSLHEETELAIDLEILYLAKVMNFRVLQQPVSCIDREGSHIRIIRDSISFIKNIIKIPRLYRKSRKRSII